MAALVLFNVADRIIWKLASLAFQEIGHFWGVDELEKLRSTMSTIHAVLLDAEEHQSLNNQLKDWIGKLKEAVYDADDLLNDFSNEALRRQVMSGPKLTKEVCLFLSGSNKLVRGLKMRHRIKAIRERLDAIAADRMKFQLEVRLLEKAVVSRERSDFIPPEVVIGREHDRKVLIGRLLDANLEQNVSVLPIVGIGGLGKTTIAQVIFNDEQVNAYFELKLWVCVSDPFDVKVIVRRILESATKRKVKDLEISVLIDRLHDKINGKRYLLVLDDIWNEDQEKWDNLKKLLVGGARGSKIIVTTRLGEVAKITTTFPPHVLEGLSPAESWSLLQQVVFKGQEPKNQKLVEIGKEIVRKCAGVPLAIRTIGSVLYLKDSEAEWLSFLEKELSQVPQRGNDILPTLELSYNYLPSHLKQCFAYCKLFPKDHRIDVGVLIQLWIAQGFVRSSIDPRESQEDAGLECFKDLLRRSFFQEVKKDEWGNMVSCKMHDLMHDLATLVGGVETISLSNNEYGNEKTLHVSFDSSFLPMNPNSKSSLRANNLRTLMNVSNTKFSTYELGLDAIFTYLRRLVVLDLHYFQDPVIPPWIRKLKHLSYLDLSDNNEIKKLPSFITSLLNLQVLKLSGCQNLRELPRDIRKLINLKHLDCKGCDLTHMPCGLGQLTSLQTLTWFGLAKGGSIFNNSGGLVELNGLNNLRGGLEICNLKGNTTNNRWTSKAVNLKEKQHLRSLELHWDTEHDVDVDCNEVLFESLQPHPNLMELYVWGYQGLSFPNWFSCLTNLVRMGITQCKGCQRFPPLHQLPSIQDLLISSLDDLVYMEWEENDHASAFFPSLKTLEILSCPRLKGWKKEDGDNVMDADDHFWSANREDLPPFHCLSRLNIIGCSELTWMPPFPTLDEALTLCASSIAPLQQTMKMKMASSSEFINLPLSKLKELEISRIEYLESIPGEGLENLTSLRVFKLSHCSNLALLPQQLQQLSCLETLRIMGCPLLEEGRGYKKSAIWPTIAHIPNIVIGWKWIQRSGEYLLG